METDNIPEINLEITTVKVEPRVMKSRVKLVMGRPIFGMHKSCRKQFGLSNPIKYWLWKKRMQKKLEQ